jgi:CheY-like chemotaxis protein
VTPCRRAAGSASKPGTSRSDRRQRPEIWGSVEVPADLGYRALQAQDGVAELALLQSPVRIDLLVTDVGLPGLNGRQLADHAREGRPRLKVLFITRYAENATFGGCHLDQGMQMITKPFSVDAPAVRIREMIEA